MKHPIILPNSAWQFNYDNAKEAAENAVDDEGNVNWWAAMAADPGVTKCPGCDTEYFRDAEKLECPECGTQWNVDQNKI